MFRIGEFSKIAQVSGRLLRYYDEIGLLSPEYIDPQTSYRYYSAQQLPRLNRILVLKELGLSLEQVARLLDQHTSGDDIRAMLTLRKAQIEQSVHEELDRLRIVESRLHQLDTHGQIHDPDVVLKSVPTQHFLALRDVLSDMGAVRRFVRRVATDVPAMLGSHSLDHIAVVIHSPIYDPAALDVEIGYLLAGTNPMSLRLTEDQTLTLRALPAVDTMATLVHVGQVDASHQGYGMLGTWIERNEWQIIGAGREILMQLPQPDNGDQAVMEIQLPVRKLDKKNGA